MRDKIILAVLESRKSEAKTDVLPILKSSDDYAAMMDRSEQLRERRRSVPPPYLFLKRYDFVYLFYPLNDFILD